jgi:hypothetical protein
MVEQEFETVRVVFDPYSYREIQSLLQKVFKEFGRDKNRWYFQVDTTITIENRYDLLFFFQNPHDAVMFSLKYS